MENSEIGNGIEIEGKYRADGPAALERAKDIVLSLMHAESRTRQMHTVLHYYDTPDLALLDSKAILRVLEGVPPWFGPLLCVKSNGAQDDGLFSRIEYELPISSAARPIGDLLEEIKGHPAHAMLAALTGKPCVPYFDTLTDRDDVRGLFETESGKKVMLECSFDHVDFIDSDTGRPLGKRHEIEIEYKEAGSDPAATREEVKSLINSISAIMMQNVPGIAPADGTRADTGYAFYPGGKQALPPTTPPAPQSAPIP